MLDNTAYPLLEETLSLIKDQYLSEEPGPWVIGWSGGKDSSFLLHLVILGLRQLNHFDRSIYIMSNDTLVESPFVNAYLEGQIQKIEQFINSTSIPIEFKLTKPIINDSFWVNVIGRGYPAPTRHFRWCTDRLKIRPSTRFIKEITEEHGQSILLLGVRRDESSERAKQAKKYDQYGYVSPNKSLKNSFVFRPIVEWSTDDVWSFLSEHESPWGEPYDELINLYRDAVGGECPVVLDPDAAPSCGNSSIRFGCWTCTVVQKDKSFRGAIENSGINFTPMADFRDWLKEVSADKSRRMGIRRNGEDGLGPMNFDLREEVLRKVFVVQEEVGLPLISDEEISEIEKIWRTDKAMFAGYFRFRELRKEREANNDHQEY